MSFLNPALLMGAAALAIPIIVHLLNRRRFKRVKWAAMRFLQVSLERNQRRMKVEDWILLLLRLAIVALIVLAEFLGGFIEGTAESSATPLMTGRL